jgi:SnoaL-like domain
LLACFAADYRSEQPAHPARTFEGVDQVRKNWSAMFEAVPDVRWEILGFAETADTAWLELRLQGTQADGSKLHEIGVVIFGVRDDKIEWARLYLEDFDEHGWDIDAEVRRMTGIDGT